MPLSPNGPIALYGSPLTPPPETGPHKPNLAIQARLAPELIAAIIEARKKGQELHFEAYGPNAGFHIDGQHFPIHSVAAERTPHEIYAYTPLPQPSLQVIGKVAGRCGVQRTLTEEDQEKLLQSRSAAENASTRTIGRIGVPDAPVKTGEKKRPAVRKGVLTASTVATALRASPVPGTAGNSPPPGATSRPSDGPPNAFQQLLIHHLAYAPTSLKQLAATLKRQAKEIRPCLDSIATSDESPTGPRPDSPTWTLRPSSYQYLRLAPASGSASGGPWLTLSPEDIKRIITDANRAFDELKLPADAPPRLALAAQQPAPPPAPAPVPLPAPTPVPTAPGTRPSDSSALKHPLPARPAAGGNSNGRLDVSKPPRVPSPADVPSREMSVETSRAPPARPPVRTAPKEKAETEPVKETPVAKRTATGTKSKSGANGKEKPKPKSKPIIAADSDGEDFVATKRDRERKPPPPLATIPIASPVPVPTPTPTPPVRVSAIHSRAGSSSSTKQTEATVGAKRSKRDADIALELEREVDSGYSEPTRPIVPPAVSTTKATLEGKKRRMNEDEPRAREREKDSEAVKVKQVEKPRVKVKERSAATAAGQAERLVGKEEIKRKRREADQDSDTSYGSDIKKKRRIDPNAPPAVTTKKREKPPIERERESESSAVEARPKKPLPAREPDVRVKERPRKAIAATKANGATVASSSTPTVSQKANGSSKKDRPSLMYTSSEDEGTPAPRRAPQPPGTAPPATRVPKPPAPSPSDAGTPRARDRDRDRRKPSPTEGFVLPPKRPPLPTNASAVDVRDRYSEVYAEYTSMNAWLASERVKVQKLLRDMDEGDHEAVNTSLVESVTKAYREAHEELVALKERLATSA